MDHPPLVITLLFDGAVVWIALRALGHAATGLGWVWHSEPTPEPRLVVIVLSTVLALVACGLIGWIVVDLTTLLLSRWGR